MNSCRAFSYWQFHSYEKDFYIILKSSFLPVNLTQVETGLLSLFGLDRLTFLSARWKSGVLLQGVLLYL